MLESVEGDGGSRAEGHYQAAEYPGKVLGKVRREDRSIKPAKANASHHELTAKAADENGGDDGGSESRSRESISL